MVVLKVKGGSLLREWDQERQRIIIWESHCCWSVGPIQLLRLPLLVPISARLSLLIMSMHTRFMFCFIVFFFQILIFCFAIWEYEGKMIESMGILLTYALLWMYGWQYGLLDPMNWICFAILFFVFLYVCYRGSYIFSS